LGGCWLSLAILSGGSSEDLGDPVLSLLSRVSCGSILLIVRRGSGGGDLLRGAQVSRQVLVLARFLCRGRLLIGRGGRRLALVRWCRLILKGRGVNRSW